MSDGDGRCQRMWQRLAVRRSVRVQGQWAGFEQTECGVIWLSFGEFAHYFWRRRERQIIEISFDAEKQEVVVAVLKLTVPSKGNVEWLGLPKQWRRESTRSIFVCDRKEEAEGKAFAGGD